MENLIERLIYKYHGCDSWEGIFRDYNIHYLKSKKNGVEVAIKEVNRQMEQIDIENSK